MLEDEEEGRSPSSSMSTGTEFAIPREIYSRIRSSGGLLTRYNRFREDAPGGDGFQSTYYLSLAGQTYGAVALCGDHNLSVVAKLLKCRGSEQQKLLIPAYYPLNASLYYRVQPTVSSSRRSI